MREVVEAQGTVASRAFWQSVSFLGAKIRLKNGPPCLSNACLARARIASQARTVQLDLGDRGELWCSVYFGLHQPMGRDARASAEGTTPSGPSVLQSCSLAVLQMGCYAPLVPDLDHPSPWPLLPAEWGSCSFVPWEAGPCFLSACRFCISIGPEACRLRRRLLCMPVPLEPIRSKNGPKLLARPTPALHRPAFGMHLPQLVTSSRPILLHLAPSPCNPRHPRHHHPDTRCNPIVSPLPPFWPVQPLPNSACTVRAAALCMEADHPPRPKPKPDLNQPTSPHRCGVLCACPDVVQHCPSSPCFWPAV